MSKQSDSRKSETMGRILRIVGAGILIPTIFLLPGAAILIKDFLKNKGIKQEYYNFQRLLKRAEKNKLLKIVQKNGEDFLEITKLGRRELLKYNMDDLKITIPKTWDGEWRMVIFDVPEKFGAGRRALSKKLKELGFYRLQKSVFVYPYECENEIDFIREFFNIRKFVISLRMPTMGEYHDLILKRHFNLL
jgi:DNA-binding transcriptional regulator PaaX